AAANQAGDVQLEAGLHKGEEPGPQPHGDVPLEHLGEHGLHKVDQVGDGDVLVNHQALHLEEGVLVAGVGGLVAEAPAGEHRPQGGAVLAHNGVLGRGGVGLQQLAVVQVIGVLHVPGGVVLGDVHRLEALVVRDDFLVVLNGKAHGGENL